MNRMKTFLIYALIIVGLFVLSILLEKGLLYAMYSPIQGKFDGKYDANSYFKVENTSAKSSKTNGYMSFDLVNSTGKDVNKCYLKINLYNVQDLLADTEYVEIANMRANTKKHFDLKFKANNIQTFNISVLKEAPEVKNKNIINVLGWDIDLANVFGLGIDLTETTYFGTKLPDLFAWDDTKSTLDNVGVWSYRIVSAIPLWAYGLGWLIFVL